MEGNPPNNHKIRLYYLEALGTYVSIFFVLSCHFMTRA
jgi:hypothetical protein